MADGQNIGNAYITVKAQPDGSFASEVGQMGDEAGGLAGELFNGKFGAILKKLPGIIAALGIAKQVGEAVVDVGEEFDAMTDAIVVGTGASGEALEELRKSAMAIGTQVPADFEKVGDVVQNLNTRLGMTGDTLEEFGAQVIAAGNMLGSDVNLDSLTGALNAFGIANEDASEKLDYLFTIGQATGIGLNDLTSIMEKTAPTMQNLGFSFEETANMAGLLDKAGLDANSTMSQMSKALVNLSKNGESAQDAYRRVVGEMQAYIEAGDTAAALDIASQVFGTRGAAQFIGALQSGVISMEQLEDAALGAGEGIMSTMDRTLDWDESLQMLENTLKVAFEPIASGVLQSIADGISTVTAFVQENSATFDALGQVLSTVADIVGTVVSPIIEAAGVIIGGLTKAVGLLAEGFNALVGTVTSVWDSITSKIQGAVEFIKGLFDFKIEWPHVPLPHFSINPPGWSLGDLLKGSLPSLGIEWYAKGGIIDGPTLIGAGEAGKEAIVPLTAPNLAPFADAVADRIGSHVIHIDKMEVKADNVDDLILSINRRLAELGAM